MEQHSVSQLFDPAHRLGFGFLRLPAKNPNNPNDIDLSQVCQMVDAFLDAGYRYFDTAYNYLGYQSEVFLKAALTDRYPRDRFMIATKLPCMELKEDSLRILLEKGLDSFGHLKGRRVRRVLLQDE